MATIGFEYGQQHSVELTVRPVILDVFRLAFPSWAGKIGDDFVIPLDLKSLSASSLLGNSTAAGCIDKSLPSTFVPGRNLLFLLYAAVIGYQREISDLVIGACETDYSGYPDCRDETIRATQVALGLGLQRPVTIHTPLMWRDKAQAWALAYELGGNILISILLNHTHTCYNGDRGLRHAWGYGCGVCDACNLRKRGWDLFYEANSSLLEPC